MVFLILFFGYSFYSYHIKAMVCSSSYCSVSAPMHLHRSSCVLHWDYMLVERYLFERDLGESSSSSTMRGEGTIVTLSLYILLRRGDAANVSAVMSLHRSSRWSIGRLRKSLVSVSWSEVFKELLWAGPIVKLSSYVLLRLRAANVSAAMFLHRSSRWSIGRLVTSLVSVSCSGVFKQLLWAGLVLKSREWVIS